MTINALLKYLTTEPVFDEDLAIAMGVDVSTDLQTVKSDLSIINFADVAALQSLMQQKDAYIRIRGTRVPESCMDSLVAMTDISVVNSLLEKDIIVPDVGYYNDLIFPEDEDYRDTWLLPDGNIGDNFVMEDFSLISVIGKSLQFVKAFPDLTMTIFVTNYEDCPEDADSSNTYDEWFLKGLVCALHCSNGTLTMLPKVASERAYYSTGYLSCEDIAKYAPPKRDISMFWKAMNHFQIAPEIGEEILKSIENQRK